MSYSAEDDLICNVIASAYHVTGLVYDAAGTLLASAPPHGESEAEILIETGCQERLLQLCRTSKKPQVLSSEVNQVWAGVPVINDDRLTKLFVLGPIFTSEISENVIVEYARSKNLSKPARARLLEVHQSTPVIPYIEYARLIAMVYYFIYREEMDISLLATAADVPAFDSEAQVQHKDRLYTAKDFHATYAFEKYIWECIREGNVAKLKRHLRTGTHGKVGEISNRDPVRQQKNAFICSVTLATRAAVEGGLNSEVAYSLSDLYIQQVEAMKNVLPVMTLNEAMLYDFAGRVGQQKRTRSYSKAINACCDYIDEHARENIRVNDVAAQVGLNPDYVSRKFKEETGLSIGDYLKEAKVSEAKSLLKYSGLSLAEISEVLSFSSQSFFSAVFKQQTGLTPRQFREKGDE